ncbi:hypothetical protein D3C84_1189880 [compost metagenome]
MGGDAGGVLAIKADAAAGDLDHADQGFQRGGLAGAVGTDQGHQLALVDVEIDTLDGLNATVGNLQVLDV